MNKIMTLRRSEYDSYKPEHPDLIPSGQADAEAKLGRVLSLPRLSEIDPTAFLQGWWALFWLYPGLHPDAAEEWDAEFDLYRPMALEAFRRHSAGEFGDSQLYPAEATHNRIWTEQQAINDGGGIPVRDSDQRVVIKNSAGLYLAYNEAGEIAWITDRARAFRYFREADAVDAQVREVKRRYNEEWFVELSNPRPEQGS